MKTAMFLLTALVAASAITAQGQQPQPTQYPCDHFSLLSVSIWDHTRANCGTPVVTALPAAPANTTANIQVGLSDSTSALLKQIAEHAAQKQQPVTIAMPKDLVTLIKKASAPQPPPTVTVTVDTGGLKELLSTYLQGQQVANARIADSTEVIKAQTVATTQLATATGAAIQQNHQETVAMLAAFTKQGEAQTKALLSQNKELHRIGTWTKWNAIGTFVGAGGTWANFGGMASGMFNVNASASASAVAVY
jgi:hypothetical protein